MPIRRIDKTLTATTATIAGEDIAASSIPVKPHIQPGVLQPAVAGKLLDGTTSHSGNYGTAQSDGHSYYYTDVIGSRSIKDPRIGGHFGSQRILFTSAQRDTGLSAKNDQWVYTVDGRESIRVIMDNLGGIDVANAKYDDLGQHIDLEGTGGAIEIVGYFNVFNIVCRHVAAAQTLNVHMNGVSAHAALSVSGVVNSPTGGRFHSCGSVRNIDITSSSSLSSDTPLAINTIKLTRVAGDSQLFGCELIAQDVGTTARRNHVNIPAQNVVSYGKKYSEGSNTLTNAVHKH